LFPQSTPSLTPITWSWQLMPVAVRVVNVASPLTGGSFSVLHLVVVRNGVETKARVEVISVTGLG
jgi:hypothetical protein